jgi:hypothetical protein
MITTDDLEGLMQREARPGSPVLSVYLDTDQTRQVRKLAITKETCDYCRQAVHEVNDLIDRADARVLEMAGRVEQVRGAAATRLQEVGSIGALLRY